jgi:hypothetical protein
MDIHKANINQILNRTFFFTLLNFSLNLFGLWFNKLMTKENFIFPESIKNEFIIPILLQSLFFALCFGAAYLFLKNKKLSWLAFVAFQLLAFHVAFFSGIKFGGGMHFETTINHLGLRYLSYNGQYLIDFVFTKMPLNGFFENGIFKPDSSLLFYFQWVFSVLAYYLGVSWLNEKIVSFFTTKKEVSKVEVLE